METVKKRQGYYKEHKDGIQVVHVEKTLTFLVLHNGYVDAVFIKQEEAEGAAAQLKIESDISEKLDEALAAAAGDVFRISKCTTGVDLPRAKMVELLEAACSALVEQYQEGRFP